MSTYKIPNGVGEQLDTLVEGPEGATTTVVMVHGFGTDKHETRCYLLILKYGSQPFCASFEKMG